MDLSVIIVNYNVKEFLENLLNSIKKASEGLTIEIIVVDNNSDDGSVELIKEKFPGVILIENNYNAGFSKANNLGLKIAKGRYLLLLNPDTLVEEDTFKKMVSFFDNTPGAGMAGCKILNPDGTLQLACRRGFPSPWASFCKVTGLSSLFPNSKFFAKYNLTYLDENQTYEVDAISGSFMMLTREAYEKIGGLDEIFFMYGEDLDYCYRIQNAGLKVYYVHTTQIIHYKGESTKRSSLNETKIFYDAMHIFVKKHFASSIPVLWLLRVAIIIREVVAFAAKKRLVFTALFLDLLFYNTAFFIGEHIYMSISGWLGVPDFGVPFVFGVPVLLYLITGSVLSVYRRDKLPVLKTFSAIFFSFFIVSSLTYFFKDFAFSRGHILVSYILLPFFLGGWRVIAKVFFKAGISDGYRQSKRSVIVGTGKNAEELAVKFAANLKSGRIIAGFIGLNRKEIGEKIGEFKVLGSVENIIKVLREHDIKEVIFSSTELSYNQMIAIVAACNKENVEFQLAGQDMEFLVGKSEVSMLNNMPFFEVNYNISSLLHRIIKRVFDLCLSFFILFFVLPPLFFLRLISTQAKNLYNILLEIPAVISGSKSFVGPKVKFTGEPYIGKPGLTGFWFTEGDEGQFPAQTDLFYAQHQNIWLDIEIIGKTLNILLNKRI
ncbi:MAG: glycosyltransferase [Ignavibacteriaceae bacterium]|nr:glycosyltransferase [Ignavibacteriaceae bacterium]